MWYVTWSIPSRSYHACSKVCYITLHYQSLVNNDNKQSLKEGLEHSPSSGIKDRIVIYTPVPSISYWCI